MARLHGKDITTITLNAQSLKGDTIHIDTGYDAETHDTTVTGSQWRSFIGGLKLGADISHELFYDNTASTGTWAFLTNLLGAAATTLVISDGVRTMSVSAIVTKLSLPMPVGDMLKITATYKQTGTVTFS